MPTTLAPPETLVHPSDVAGMLPCSPITRRPYTLTCIYRWLKHGRLTIHRRNGKIYAGYSDVVALALELSAVPA